MLRLTESWYGKEDTHLTDRLLKELPGILLGAIDGWKRLTDAKQQVWDKIHNLD